MRNIKEIPQITGNIGDVNDKWTAQLIHLSNLQSSTINYLSKTVAKLEKEVNKLQGIKQTRRKQGHTGELFDLIRENPDLPIMCWVDSDIVAEDGCNRWRGSFGQSWIVEYIEVEMYRGYLEIVEKGETERYEEWLADHTEMTDEEIEKYIKNIQWTKAIAVNIDLPE